MARPLSTQRDAHGYLPIESYGAIGNGRTIALVGSDGAIDWCPMSRIDRPSVFGRILDAQIGGYWQIAPVEPFEVARSYLDDTNILVTTFTTSGGRVELIDLMPSIAFSSDLGLSKMLWDGMLVRIARAVSGTIRLRSKLRPGFDYARARAEFEIVPGRGVLACSRHASLRLHSTLPVDVSNDCISQAVELRAGTEQRWLVSHHGSGAPMWVDLADEVADHLLQREVKGWRDWIGRCTYHGPYADTVRRSALVLKLLDYAPSGAMAAAATTSLPERIGGVRNWDYRYAWIRDTTYALHALLSIGYRDEAEGFLQWVIDTTHAQPESLQIMYRVTGAQDLEEKELPHLAGYRNSRPVRIGNGAWDQRQLDRFGEVIDAAWLHRRFGGAISDALWTYVVAVANEVLQRWRQPDSGIWEVRSEPRRFTFSNVMCWVALDRAVRLAEIDHRDAPLSEWRRTRDTIRDEIMTFGVRDGVFTQGFGDAVLDASALSFPLRNFVDVHHPVMRATIEAIERHLTDDGLVSRYLVADRARNVDGLPGDEGRFVLCSCWLIDCLVGLGQIDRAEALLEQLLARANDLGLYSEEIAHGTGEFLGNFPQAFSHLGIINAIVNIGRARGHVEHAPHGAERDVSGAMPAGHRHPRL